MAQLCDTGFGVMVMPFGSDQKQFHRALRLTPDNQNRKLGEFHKGVKRALLTDRDANASTFRLNPKKMPVAFYEPVNVGRAYPRVTEAPVKALPVPQRTDKLFRVVNRHNSVTTP